MKLLLLLQVAKAWLALHPAVVGCFMGAFNGWAGAARTDYLAFKTWKSFHDAQEYQWGLAFWRWFQGAISGAVSGTSLGVVWGLIGS